MKANLLRNLTLLFGLMALLFMALMAYGSYTTLKAEATADTCIQMNNSNVEMPWESMARQLIGAVSFQ